MRDFLGHEASLSHTFTGTLAYMAPERLSGGSSSPYGGGNCTGLNTKGNGSNDDHDRHMEEEGYSYPADVWGLGLSLLALALGKPPLTGRMRSVWDVLAAQVRVLGASQDAKMWQVARCTYRILPSFFVLPVAHVSL